MKILLIQSYTVLNEPPLFPLGLCYVASNLNGHEIKIVDLNISPSPLQELETTIREFCPFVVGISLRNINIAQPGVLFSSLNPHVEVIRLARNSLNDGVIIIGGSTFSLYATSIMEMIPEVDLGVFGEGEESFRDLLDNLSSPERVPGIYCRRGGKPLFTGYRDWMPPGEIGFPRRDLLNMRRYTDVPFTIGVQTKRGCVLKCIHCSDRYLLGENLRLRNPGLVVDEIEQLVKESGVKTLSFVDQIFNIPVNHAQEICQEIIRRKLRVKWTAWFNEKYISEHFLKIVKEAGCARLSFSPDSASDKVLKNLRKNFTARELSRTYELARKVDMKIEYGFMINAPGETIFTLFKTLIFVIKAKLVLGKNFILHNLLMTRPIRIYPHAEIKEIAIKEGIIDKNLDLVEPVFYNPPPLKYMVSLLRIFSRLVWWMRERLKRRVTP